MREFMRQKREERTPIGEEGPSSQGVRKRQKASTRRTIATTKKGSAKGEGQDDADSDVTERDDGASSEHDSDRAADNNRLLTCTPSSLSRRRSHSPQGMLDASRRDPFQAFPMRLDEEDLPLVDHCKPTAPKAQVHVSTALLTMRQKTSRWYRSLCATSKASACGPASRVSILPET